MLVGDPLDRDSDYYVLVQGQNRWWDASDSASINSKSFNRYAEWLRLWNVKAAKRWVLWQIPLGNSNHRNVANDGSARAGYKDNRPEYFFGNGTAHMAKFADAGVIGLLFGAGAGGQSSYQNDNYTDGQLFMKSRAGAILNAGGVTLATGGGATSGHAAARRAAAARPARRGAAARPGRRHAARRRAGGHARSTTSSRARRAGRSSGAPLTGAASSTTRAFAGTHALAVSVGGSGTATVTVSSPAAGPGKVVTFHLWVPSGSGLSSLQPFAAPGRVRQLDLDRQLARDLVADGERVEHGARSPSRRTPRRWLSSASRWRPERSWTGTLYVDAVAW